MSVDRLSRLARLASEKINPSVTISLNTHRTHPDNAQDAILLKNLCAEAEKRLIDEFGKRPVAKILDDLSALPEQIDIQYNLDSLHIFLSNDTKEMLKSTWPTTMQGVYIDERFAVRDAIKAYNRSESYLLMVLSQGGVQLYEVINDAIVEEIRNDDFPFKANPHYITHSDKRSQASLMDNMLREYFNKVDKALVKVYNQMGLPCVVISTEQNNSHLMHVADRPAVYVGHSAINYNAMAEHDLGKQAWVDVIEPLQKERRAKAIEEMQEAVAGTGVLTDLQEIYQAAIDGRADLLIVHESFAQPVIMKDERTFDFIDDPTVPGAIDDIVSVIAWEVVAKGGRSVFTQQDQFKSLGKIALKPRY